MSILTDRQIKELCVRPTYFGIQHIPLPSPTVDGRIYSVMRSAEIMVPLWGTEEEAKAEAEERGYRGHARVTDEHAKAYEMISPFVPHQVRTRAIEPIPGEVTTATPVADEKILSYGLSSMGYDVRLAEDFKIFSNIGATLIDPLDFDHNCCVDHNGPYCIIPPNSYILGHTIERFKIPDDVMVVCVGKSTYARLGAIVNVTPIEPGFEGTVVIEISNATPLPLKVYANMGIAQFMFFRASEPCEVSYAVGDRKYQSQTGLATARL
jgi:dCTP deaminase